MVDEKTTKWQMCFCKKANLFISLSLAKRFIAKIHLKNYMRKIAIKNYFAFVFEDPEATVTNKV